MHIFMKMAYKYALHSAKLHLNMCILGEIGTKMQVNFCKNFKTKKLVKQEKLRETKTDGHPILLKSRDKVRFFVGCHVL